MKRAFFITLMVVMMLFVSSCKKEETGVPDGMFYEKNDAVNYTLYLPEGWIIDRNDGMVSAHADEKDRSNVSVTTFALPREYNLSLSEYINNEYEKYFNSNFVDMEILKDFSDTTLDKRPAKKVVFKASVGNIPYQFMQILTLNTDGYVYVFTYTSTPDAYDTHEEEVNSMLTEFTFNR